MGLKTRMPKGHQVATEVGQDEPGFLTGFRHEDGEG